MGKIIGIDLGTTNSCVAVLEGKDPVVIPINLWIGTTLPFLPMLSRIGLLAGYGLVFACGGYLLFERKEA